jgi:RimJ/RimL family protein N-acetyltransferase
MSPGGAGGFTAGSFHAKLQVVVAPYPRSEPAELALLARTLFTQDAAGHLVDVNEAGGPRAPRLFLAWNDRGMLCRVRGDVPAALAGRIAAIVAEQPATGDLEHPPGCVAAARAALAEHAPVDHEDGQLEYRFPALLDAPADAVAVTPDSAEVLQRWLPSWVSYAALGLPMTAVLVDGAAVSVCACVRVPGDATEAGIATHPAFRGRGHAVTVTAAWARAVRDRGITPLYGTSWRNQASQRVATKLGLIKLAGSWSIE